MCSWFFLLTNVILATCIASDISLESQSIEITVEDRYAFINYLFYFKNTNINNSASLSYEISLQPNTFISHFFAELNGFIFKGKTKEQSEALKEYNEAVELGLNAVLVSQDHDANIFNIKTNIEKGGDAMLNITAERFMLRRFGYYELSSIISNNYNNIDSQFINTDISINLYDNNGISYVDVIVPTNGDYNTNKLSSYQYDIDINLAKSETDSQQLILLRYKTETMENNNQLLYDDESATFMHIFSYEDQSVLPRRVIFVLDKSGSMGTTKWESAVSATIGAIKNLKVGVDKMNIILFSSESVLYSETIVSVTSDIKTASVEWINGYSSGGGTNIYQGVIDGINLIKNDMSIISQFQYVNQIILITDGQPTSGVTDPTEIQNGLLDANNILDPAPASIFCLGIGDDYGSDWVRDLNYPLLRSIATQNDGFDARVKQSETKTILTEYYNILESPVLSFIALDYSTNGQTNTVHSLTRNKYRGLYAGTDIVVSGKITDNTATEVIISLLGRRGGTLISTSFPIQIENTFNTNIVVDRIWAYLRLKMYRRLLDNPRLAALDLTNFETGALNLALEYELVTPWTSMIVVDDRTVVNITNTTQNSINNEDIDSNQLDSSLYSQNIQIQTGGGGQTGGGVNKISPQGGSSGNYYYYADDDDDDLDEGDGISPYISPYGESSKSGSNGNYTALWVFLAVVGCLLIAGIFGTVWYRNKKQRVQIADIEEVPTSEDIETPTKENAEETGMTNQNLLTQHDVDGNGDESK